MGVCSGFYPELLLAVAAGDLQLLAAHAGHTHLGIALGAAEILVLIPVPEEPGYGAEEFYHAGPESLEALILYAADLHISGEEPDDRENRRNKAQI